MTRPREPWEACWQRRLLARLIRWEAGWAYRNAMRDVRAGQINAARDRIRQTRNATATGGTR